MPEAPFKICPLCKTAWNTREDLTHDPTVSVVGYQAIARSPEDGLFLFTHMTKDCRSTFAIPVREYRDFFAGTRYARALTGESECHGFCQDSNNLESCGAQCSMRWARDVLQFLRRHEVPPHLEK